MAAQEYSWAKIVSLNSIANQRRAQLTKVPLFEVSRFRWGFLEISLDGRDYEKREKERSSKADSME